MTHEKLYKFVGRLIDLRQDELKKVILLQIYIFLTISVLLILKPLSTSMMISRYGVDIMPVAYLCIAGSAVLVHFLIIALRKRVSLFKAILYNSLINVIILSLFTIKIYDGALPPMLTVVVYVYVSLLSLTTVTLFFQYCQALLTIREAKRVLSYIGAGAIAGGVFGGYFATVVITLAGNVGLILASISFIIISAIIMYYIHTRYADFDEQDQTLSVNQDDSFLSTLKNKHVSNVAMIIGLGVLVAKLIDYQFNDVAHQSFADDEMLTAFFAATFSSINIVGLILQLFFANSILDRLGVTKSIAVLPFFLLIGMMIFLFFPVLITGVLIKLIDGSLKQSLYKTATEINIMPLPTNIRDRAKTLVDVVIDSAATGISGIIIFLLVNLIDLPTWSVSIATILALLMALYYIILSRKTYMAQLSNMVIGNTTDAYEEHLDWTPQNYLDRYLSGTKRHSKDRADILIEISTSPSPSLRAAAIAQLMDEYGLKYIDRLGHVKQDSSILVRKRYHEARLELINNPDELNAYFNSLSTQEKIICTTAIAKLIGRNERQIRKYRVHERIDWVHEQLVMDDSIEKKYKRLFFESVAHSGYIKYYHLISEALKSNDEKLKMYAVYALKEGRVPDLFSELFQTKVYDKNLKRWHKALSAYPSLLLHELRILHKTNKKHIIRALPALSYTHHQMHVNYLYTLLNNDDIKLRHTAVSVLGDIQQSSPYLNFYQRRNKARIFKIIKEIENLLGSYAIVIDEREDNMDVEKDGIYEEGIKSINKNLMYYLESVFILLGITLEKKEISNLYNPLRNDSSAEIILDYLDEILPYNLKSKIIPMIELVIDYDRSITKLLEYGIKIPRKRKAIKTLRKLSPTKYKALINNL